jgi:Domain of unknown function (DUF4919)
MRRLAALAGPLLAIAALPALAAPSAADARYQALLAKAMASEPTTEGWRDLRYAYAATSGFNPDAGDEAEIKMLTDFRAGDCAAALADAKAASAADYVDPDPHLIASICNDKLGAADAARRELGVGLGLITSIESTGDGASPAHAMEVIAVGEEYSVLRVKGWRVTRQALIRQDGHNYDALTTVDDKGQARLVYFLVDRVLAAEAAALKPGSVTEGGPPR